MALELFSESMAQLPKVKRVTMIPTIISSIINCKYASMVGKGKQTEKLLKLLTNFCEYGWSVGYRSYSII